MQDNPFQRMNRMPDMPDFRQNARMMLITLGIVFLLLTAFQSFFRVEPSQVGVVKRFGKHVRTSLPGLGYKIPWGIETLTKVKVTEVRFEVFGLLGQAQTSRPQGAFQALTGTVDTRAQARMASNRMFSRKVGFDENSLLPESLMMTGDLNFAEVTWEIQYYITNPVHYLFNVQDVEGTLRAMAESVMREVVGDSSINKLITYGKDQIRDKAREELQRLLDQMQCGITITNFALQDVNPPAPVKSAFEEVNKAEQEMWRMRNQAQAAYNKIIPKVEGEAKQIVLEAEGYAVERVNRAKGQADRFLQVWKAYDLAKDVTRRRLYLETMNELLPQVSEKIIVDTDVPGILPILDLAAQSISQSASNPAKGVTHEIR